MTRKRPLPLHEISGEQAAREQHDQLLDGDEARGGVSGHVGQAHEAAEDRGQTDEGAQRPPVARADHHQCDAGAEVGQEREGMGRIDGERRQDREGRD